MPITKRTLEKWRREALKSSTQVEEAISVDENWAEPYMSKRETVELNKRIIRLTMELLDVNLLRKV